MKTIKIGQEYITKNKGDASAGYVMIVKAIEKATGVGQPAHDDIILFQTQDMKRVKGVSKITIKESSARRWWFNDYCILINR